MTDLNESSSFFDCLIEYIEFKELPIFVENYNAKMEEMVKKIFEKN
jgi:hypothetical protein